METKNLMDVALRAGEILLCSGAEVYRVEETILRIFKSYGKNAECFVLLSGIFITAQGDNGNDVTIVRRLRTNTFDLKKIELVNSFSRSLEKKPLSYEESMEILEDITNISVYGLKQRVFYAGLMAFVYALLFKGSLYDGGAAFIIGVCNYYIKTKVSEFGFFQFLEYFISGIIVGGLSIIAAVFFPVLDVYKVIIGGIMIVVPGMAITTALKDALYGDIVSSLYRITEAIFISVAIGSGVALMLSAGLRYL